MGRYLSRYKVQAAFGRRAAHIEKHKAPIGVRLMIGLTRKVRHLLARVAKYPFAIDSIPRVKLDAH